MEYAIAALILVALGFLYYGWIRLRQEAEAKARQLIFRKSHREGEGAVGRSHRVTPRSASAQELLDAAWAAIDVPEGTESLDWLSPTIFKVRTDDQSTIFFTLKWKFGSPNWIAMLSLEDDGSLSWSVPKRDNSTVWYPKQRAWPIWSDESSGHCGCAIPTAS